MSDNDAPAWTKGHEKPGKLSEQQREYILQGSNFHDGEPIPFGDLHIPYQGRSMFLGLVKRGFYENYKTGFYRLTPKGYRAARAILALDGSIQAQHRIKYIDTYMSKGQSA
jgi:hypothetical protein